MKTGTRRFAARAGISRNGGGKGIRTPDLMAASHALSQLSYAPAPGPSDCQFDTHYKGMSALVKFGRRLMAPLAADRGRPCPRAALLTSAAHADRNRTFIGRWSDELQEWMLLGGIVFVAGLIHGLIGIGYSIILVSVLVATGHGLGSSTTVSMITCGFCQLLIIYKLRGRMVFSAVWPLMVGAACALPVGLFILHRWGGAPWMRQVLGVFVASVACWLLAMPRRPRIDRKPRRLLGVGAGVLSGLGGGLFNIGGPTAALYTYSRPVPLDSAKASIQWFFMAATIYRLAITYGGQMVTWRETLDGLAVAPAVIVGTLLGVAVADRVQPWILRRAVYALLVLTGLKLCLWP